MTLPELDADGDATLRIDAAGAPLLVSSLVGVGMTGLALAGSYEPAELFRWVYTLPATREDDDRPGVRRRARLLVEDLGPV